MRGWGGGGGGVGNAQVFWRPRRCGFFFRRVDHTSSGGQGSGLVSLVGGGLSVNCPSQREDALCRHTAFTPSEGAEWVRGGSGLILAKTIVLRFWLGLFYHIIAEIW